MQREQLVPSPFNTKKKTFQKQTRGIQSDSFESPEFVKPLFPLFLEDLEGVFLAAGSGICVFSCRAAVLFQRALLGGQLRDAGATLCPQDPWLPSSGGRWSVRFSWVGAERAGGLWQGVYLSKAGQLLHAAHVLHYNGAIGEGLCGIGFVNAVPSVGGVAVQWDNVVSTSREPVNERGGLDDVTFGAVGRQSITNLGEWQGRVRIRSV